MQPHPPQVRQQLGVSASRLLRRTRQHPKPARVQFAARHDPLVVGSTGQGDHRRRQPRRTDRDLPARLADDAAEQIGVGLPPRFRHAGTLGREPRGPRGGEPVSVAHYGKQNSDLMRDPEIVFEIVADSWHPVSIQMDYTGHYREAVFVGDDGKVYVRTALVRDIAAFARIWDRNIKAQGFVDAAESCSRGVR
jgi:hypothetical protein